MISIKLLLKICFRKKKNLFKKQKRHEKTCAVLRNKTCFYLQSRSGHSNCFRKVFHFEYTKTERVWCALFYFIKCKANTVSAKSVQSSSLESQITGFLLYVYIQYIHKFLLSNFLAASLSTVMTSRRQLEYHIGTAQPPNWRHWQIVCTTSMAVLCECEKFRHRKFYVRVLTDNQEKRPLHFGL